MSAALFLNPRLYTETYQHRRFTLRFGETIEAHEAPALFDETTARLASAIRLRDAALVEVESQIDHHERNAAVMLIDGATAEIDNLTSHLSRVEALLR